MGIFSLVIALGIIGAFLYLIVMNLLELLAVLKLEDKEDKPGQQAWVIWGLVAGGLISGVSFLILVGWVMLNWVWPLDYDKATVGDIRLYGAASTTANFFIGLLLLTLALVAVIFLMVFTSM